MSSLGGSFSDFDDTQYDDWGNRITKENKIVTIINHNHIAESELRPYKSKPNHIRINELERKVENLERQLNKALKILRSI